MEIATSKFGFDAVLEATLIRADGTHADWGILGSSSFRMPKWRKAYEDLKKGRHIPALMTFGAFLSAALSGDPKVPFLLGVITTAGAVYTAADFIVGGSAHLSAFNWHDSGTGTNAAAVGNTTLQTATGEARVAGTQTSPTSTQYRTVAAITYGGSFAVSEWGLFSAATNGTLWDRRRFTTRNVVATQIITYTYTLTVSGA